MNSSLITADVTAHLRILFLALLSAFLVVGIGMNARVTAGKTSLAESRIEAPAPEPDGAPAKPPSSGKVVTV
jgi:hypothetical protein